MALNGAKVTAYEQLTMDEIQAEVDEFRKERYEARRKD